MKIRYVDDFPLDVHEELIRAYLIDSKSHRQIQREILGLPAPDHGGGFVTMAILHYYDIREDQKGILKTSTLERELEGASDQYRRALMLVSDINEYIDKVNDVIEGKASDYCPPDGPTELPVESKRRISHSSLRRRVLKNYSKRCALCEVQEVDLLVCSHITPWSIDEKNRLNPMNAICLCVWHDKLFDKGYFSLGEGYRLIVSTQTPIYIEQGLRNLIFQLPLTEPPDDGFLQYHEEEILKK